MHIKNQPIFRSSGFPCNQRWIRCIWSPQYRWTPPEHPRDISHTFSASCLGLPIRPVGRVGDSLYRIFGSNLYTLWRMQRATTPTPNRACVRACACKQSRTSFSVAPSKCHWAVTVLLTEMFCSFFYRKTVSGLLPCVCGPLSNGGLVNVLGQHPSLHKERSAINRSLGILKALYTVIMSANIIAHCC